MHVQRKVNIFDRNGRLYDEVPLPQPEVQLSDSGSPSCLELQVCGCLPVSPLGRPLILWS